MSDRFGMVLDPLPDRPLRRAEVNLPESSDTVAGIYPIYGDRAVNHDNSPGFVIVIDGTANAVVFDGSEWDVVEKAEVDSDGEGVHFDDFETVQELQGVVTEHL